MEGHRPVNKAKSIFEPGVAWSHQRALWKTAEEYAKKTVIALNTDLWLLPSICIVFFKTEYDCKFYMLFEV